MGSEGGDSFQFSAEMHGDGQINQGREVNATNTVNKGDTVTFAQFMSAIEKAVEESERAVPEDVRSEAIEPLKQMAEEEPPETEQEQQTFRARIAGYVAKLEPYVPDIRRTIAAFAEGALSTIPPPAGWVVAGVIEVVRDARRG